MKEYPRILYKAHAHRLVHSDKERDEALADGWALTLAETQQGADPDAPQHADDDSSEDASDESTADAPSTPTQKRGRSSKKS